jgi:starch-binding outer membrane protein, SusD/RagB family
MKKYVNHNNYKLIIPIVFIVALASCKKFVEAPPPLNEITGATVYSNNSSAISVMTGLYSNMMASPSMSSGFPSIGFSTGLSSDELINEAPNNPQQVQFYENAVIAGRVGTPGQSDYLWQELYNYIYVTNTVLEGLGNSTAVTAPVKQQTSGEAKFMRAFFHFYATNLYGDVPLVTSTNYLVNNTSSRSPQALVYEQIIADLKDAQSKLNSNFVDANGAVTMERTRPNQEAATALLARVYLFTAKYDSAAMEATKVIANSEYSLDTLNGVFLANSSEAIWQLRPVSPGYNTLDAYYYVLHGVPGPPYGVVISPYLLSAFENGDARYTNWVDSISSGGTTYYFPYKYKVWQQNEPITEYTMVLRLAEQYLIRAEAEAHGAGGGLTAAIADLNVIRNRAGLPDYNGSATDASAILAAVTHERQVELFTEWGHRWFDLIRTGLINSVLGSPGNVCAAKGGTWIPDKALLPIPYADLQIDPNLKQNQGY